MAPTSIVEVTANEVTPEVAGVGVGGASVGVTGVGGGGDAVGSSARGAVGAVAVVLSGVGTAVS